MNKWHLALLLALPTICKAPVRSTCHITTFEDDNRNKMSNFDTIKPLPLKRKTQLVDVLFGKPLPLFATLLNENANDCEITLVDGNTTQELTLPYGKQHTLTFCAGYLALNKIDAPK